MASKSVVALALCGTALLAAAKLGAVLHGGSSAMLASTVQSIIDVSFLALLIYGLSGRSSNSSAGGAGDQGFWTAVVPILLYALGAGVTLYDGIEHVARPRASGGYPHDEVLLAAGVVLSSVTLWLTSRSPEETRRAIRPDPERMAVTVQAASSAAGHVAAIAGATAASRWEVAQADGMAAVAVGIVLVGVAAMMAIEAGRQLRGRETALVLPATRTTEAAQSATIEPTVELETKSMVPVETPSPAPAEAPPRVAAPPSPSGKPQIVARHPPGKKNRGKRRR